ncbi:MAG TPA: hypothetical protein VHJ38_06415 [Nitrososphaeraceae archaeon]|jgi:hypothetical protein|nr:hypothetical protein [Nitrososphaeraceae archaeon]
MDIWHPVIESALGEIHSRCVWLTMNRCESEAGDNNYRRAENTFQLLINK